MSFFHERWIFFPPLFLLLVLRKASGVKLLSFFSIFTWSLMHIYCIEGMSGL